MQYILTQEEYDKLVARSDMLRINNIHLRAELLELQDKYAKLLVSGVSTNNEKLKGH